VLLLEKYDVIGKNSPKKIDKSLLNPGYPKLLYLSPSLV
jgi:hypothetical protein